MQLVRVQLCVSCLVRGKYIPCQSVVSGGLAFFKRRKKKVGVSKSPLVPFSLVNQCLMGFGVSKKNEAN